MWGREREQKYLYRPLNLNRNVIIQLIEHFLLITISSDDNVFPEKEMEEKKGFHEIYIWL